MNTYRVRFARLAASDKGSSEPQSIRVEADGFKFDTTDRAWTFWRESEGGQRDPVAVVPDAKLLVITKEDVQAR